MEKVFNLPTQTSNDSCKLTLVDRPDDPVTPFDSPVGQLPAF